jgi:hypothetical protein
MEKNSPNFFYIVSQNWIKKHPAMLDLALQTFFFFEFPILQYLHKWKAKAHEKLSS